MGTTRSVRGPRRASRRLGLALGIVAALVASACGSAADEDAAGGEHDLGTIRVYVTVPQSDPFVAIEGKDIMGTWEGSGLNVQLIQGSTPKAGQAIASGQADIALAGATAFASIAQGSPEISTAAIQNVWTQVIIASPRLNAKSLEDLKGKNFGLTGETAPGAYSLKKVAEKLGWSDSDYKTTTLGSLPTIIAALKSGSIDAFPWGIDQGVKLEAQGLGQIVGGPDVIKDMVGPIMFQGFTVRKQYADENKEALEVFFTRYYETVKKMQADPSLFVKVLVSWNVKEDVAKRLAELELPTYSTDGTLTDEAVQNSGEYASFLLGRSVEAKFTHWQDLVNK